MSLMNLVTVIAGVGLLMTSAAPSGEDEKPSALNLLSRYGQSCTVNNRVYRHGQVFTLGESRCIKYLCNDGNYHFYQEGCEMWDRCWPANQQFDYKCRRYMCYASFIGGGVKKYEIRPVSRQNCQDIHGACKRPGEFFDYVMEGRYKRRCSCRPGRQSTTYYCYD